MNKLDERGWKILTSAILNKEVVPIIGKELFKVNDEPLQNYINRKICENRFIDYKENMSVDQVIDKINETEGDGKRKFCNELHKIFSKNDFIVPESLKKLVGIGRFPMILTTSYTPILEKYLTTSSKENWKCYAYDKTSKADIYSSNLKTNILYYLFGKLGLEGTFVIDEDDLLSFLHFWHDEAWRPKELCRYLNDKYLLVIGCDYPDWLFRFLWYSMNDNFNEKGLRKGQLIISNKKVMEDLELQSFLRRIKAYYNNDYNEFIDELVKRIESIVPSNSIQEPEIGKEVNVNPKNHTTETVDFFISYAHEDFTVAQSIASSLQKLGATIWLDDIVLQPGDKFPDDIKQNIENCKRFIPIISNHSIENKRRFFRREWKTAIDEAGFRLGMPYITPIRIDNVDVNHALIPDEFKNVHIIDFNEELEDKLKDLIRNLRRL